jgi:ketosteroid isomerase-like protein
MRRTLILLVCAAALAATAGCGKTDEQAAQDAVNDYVAAQNDRDFQRVCELYSDELRQQLVGVTSEEQCSRFLEEQTSGDAKGDQSVVGVRVKDDHATADIDVVREGEGPSRVTLTLERQDGGWRITALQ